MIAIEEDALHRSRGAGFFFCPLARERDSLGAKLVVVAIVNPATEVAAEGAKPAQHVFPGKKNGDGNAILGGIFRAPASDGTLVARLVAIALKDRPSLPTR